MKLSKAVDIGISSLSAIFEYSTSREISCDVYFMLSCLLNMSTSSIKANSEMSLTESQIKLFNNWIERRMKYEPVQYITGETEFWSLRIKLEKGVLIPRQDSETLISLVLDNFNINSKLNFLDLCCGSGCIGLALLSSFPNALVDFVDNYSIPISCTKKNIEEHNFTNRSSAIKSNMFEKLQIQYKFDLYDAIISNPPYISAKELTSLPLDISIFEPYEALKGGDSGLFFHEIIAKNAQLFLKNKGLLFLEIGYNQSEQVVSLFESNKWQNIQIIKDLSNNPRVLIAKKS